MIILLAVIFSIVAFCCILFGFMEDSMKIKIAGYIAAVLFIVCMVIWTQTESGARTMKSMKSDTSGGLSRTVEVYDQDGDLIRTYSGKIDIEDTEYGNKVLFDLDGKRTVIYNATVIVQEK